MHVSISNVTATGRCVPRGQKTADGVLTGYWEWFRKDGTKMRSGYFDDGEQVGEWTTYDKQGKVYKVTQMKAKAVSERGAGRRRKQ